MDIFKNLFFVVVYLIVLFVGNSNCLKKCTATEFIISQDDIKQFENKNLTIKDQPFYYHENKVIYQAAIQNEEFELELKKNSTNDRPIQIDRNRLPKYLILVLEEKEGIFTLISQHNFEDKKIVGFTTIKTQVLTTIQTQLIAVSSQGLIRIINLQNNTLEEQFIDLKARDVEGIQSYKYNNDHFFVVYGKNISINYFEKDQQLKNLYNNTNITFHNAIKNVAYSNKQVFFYSSKELFAFSFETQKLETKITIQEYQQAYIFQLFQNTILILPYQENNQTSTYMFYEINNPSKQQTSYKLRNQQDSIKSAVSLYQGQILVKNENNEIRSIEFDDKNVQIRNQTNEKLSIGVDFSQVSKQMLLMSNNEDKYIQNLCNHCEDDQFIVVSYYILPNQCGYQCKQCIGDKQCTLCHSNYSLKNGICQCANKYIENVEKGVCEKQEEQDPIFYIIIAAIICVIISLICIIKYLQIQERKRIESKQKLFKSTLNDDDDDVYNEGDDDDDYDEEDLQQNNISALHDRFNGNNQLDQQTDEHKINNKGQKASQNKSFAQQKLRGQAVQLDDFEDNNRNQIRTINEVEEGGYSSHSEHEDYEQEDD